jgi:DNA-binding MurR/RpiR family transcriptional regulator
MLRPVDDGPITATPASGPPGVAEQIRQRLADFSPAERKVARALLSGPLTIGLESSAQLARRIGVSGPTVSRFVSRLGYDSYGGFQQELRDDLQARVMSPLQVYRSHVGTTAATPLEEAGGALADAIVATMRQLGSADFQRATGYLTDTRRQVMAAGGWFSHLLAGTFVALLRQFRPRVHQVQPIASERAASVADIGRRDTVAVFDFRRYERDTFEFAKEAKDAGARIVLFTDPWLSPVADLADAVLPAHVVGPAPFESLTPTLALVETLVSAVAQGLGDAGDQRFSHFGGIADHWVRPWPSYDDLDATADSTRPSERGTSASPDRPDPRSR